MSQGWICPKCLTGNNPSVLQCPCNNVKNYISGTTTPYLDSNGYYNVLTYQYAYNKCNCFPKPREAVNNICPNCGLPL